VLFTMRMSTEERGRLDRIATHRGVKAARLIREWLQREESDIGIDRLTSNNASTFAEAQARYEQGGRQGRGDEAESAFYEEDGKRMYALQTRSVVLAIFKVLRNGHLREIR
jgi:hypothetical protein